jgi:hypothetical protein
MKKRVAKAVKIKQPAVLPGDKKYRSPFTYQCSKGHWVEGRKAVSQCPAYHRGSPCPGTLKQVGKGSGRGSHLKKAAG